MKAQTILGMAAIAVVLMNQSVSACDKEGASCTVAPKEAVVQSSPTTEPVVQQVELVSAIQDVLSPKAKPAAPAQESVTVEASATETASTESLNNFGASQVVALDENGNRVKPTAKQLEDARKARSASKNNGTPTVKTVQVDGKEVLQLTNLPRYSMVARINAEGNVETGCFEKPEQAQAWMNEPSTATQATTEGASH